MNEYLLEPELRSRLSHWFDKIEEQSISRERAYKAWMDDISYEDTAEPPADLILDGMLDLCDNGKLEVP